MTRWKGVILTSQSLRLTTPDQEDRHCAHLCENKPGDGRNGKIRNALQARKDGAMAVYQLHAEHAVHHETALTSDGAAAIAMTEVASFMSISPYSCRHDADAACVSSGRDQRLNVVLGFRGDV